jgi:DinB superfamily
MATAIGIPKRDEAAAYYFRYIDQVPVDNVVAVMAEQALEVPDWLINISENESLFRYEQGKWTLREVLSHINDCERVFQARAFWFARGFTTSLPSFDQDTSIAAADANRISWREHIDEFRAVRSSTLIFFRNLPDAAWDRKGIASDNPFTVRALAYITAGHLIHHLTIIRERYLKR